MLCQAKKIGCKSLTHSHVQYCTKYTHTNTHTHTLAHTRHTIHASSTSRGYWAQEQSLSLQYLAGVSKNDLKTTFLIILSHQIKGRSVFQKKKKGKKKRVLPLTPKKAFSGKKKLLPLHNKIQNNYDRLHELLGKKKNATRAVTLYYACLIGRGSQPTFTFPASRYGRFAL